MIVIAADAMGGHSPVNIAWWAWRVSMLIAERKSPFGDRFIEV
jgi:hypothetical protein